MQRNTQRLIAGLLVFVMIAALVVGLFSSRSASQPVPSSTIYPTAPTTR